MKSKLGAVPFYCGVSLLVAVGYFLPQVLIDFIPQVQTVSSINTQVSRNIYTDGVVEELNKREVRVELPIVPEQVMVEVGDVVVPNQILATVDTAATQNAVFALADSANLIPQEYADAFSSLSFTADFVREKIPQVLTAPMGGTITGLSLVQGAMSTPQSVVCTISSTDLLRLRLSVEEMEAERVKVGDNVIVVATATGATKYMGVVEKIFPTAGKQLSGTTQRTVVSLYVKPTADTGALKPGYNVSGSIITGDAEEAQIIPYEAVCQDSENREFVWLYEEGHCYRRDITTGEELANGVAVTHGITFADLIILNPTDSLSEGKLVRWKGES